MSDEQLDELRRAAELHDIGKAAVPDAILNKPGRLDAARVGVHGAPHVWSASGSCWRRRRWRR